MSRRCSKMLILQLVERNSSWRREIWSSVLKKEEVKLSHEDNKPEFISAYFIDTVKNVLIHDRCWIWRRCNGRFQGIMKWRSSCAYFLRQATYLIISSIVSHLIISLTQCEEKYHFYWRFAHGSLFQGRCKGRKMKLFSSWRFFWIQEEAGRVKEEVDSRLFKLKLWRIDHWLQSADESIEYAICQ
jgi:hypothetical protein